jgi:hypothetical protein
VLTAVARVAASYFVHALRAWGRTLVSAACCTVLVFAPLDRACALPSPDLEHHTWLTSRHPLRACCLHRWLSCQACLRFTLHSVLAYGCRQNDHGNCTTAAVTQLATLMLCATLLAWPATSTADVRALALFVVTCLYRVVQYCHRMTRLQVRGHTSSVGEWSPTTALVVQRAEQ